MPLRRSALRTRRHARGETTPIPHGPEQVEFDPIRENVEHPVCSKPELMTSSRGKRELMPGTPWPMHLILYA